MAQPKVFIGVGHGGSDPGAVGNGFKEKDLALSIAKYARDELKRHNVNVGMSRSKDENDDINQEVKECNAFNPDLAGDIHLNAGGGDGAEVYHYSKGGTSKTLAKNIANEIANIGQNLRIGDSGKKDGLKTRVENGRDYYAFIRDVNAPSVIIETAFIDNKTDIKILDTEKELKAMGIAIAKGFLKTLKIKYVPEPKDVYTVQVEFSKKSDATSLQKKLKSDGYKATVVKSSK